jgi:hypothetical protein
VPWTKQPGKCSFVTLPDLQLFDKYLKKMTVKPSKDQLEDAQLPPKMPQPIAETSRRDESGGVIHFNNINN